MYRIPLLLALGLSMLGCVDATGIFNDCSGEMTEVRLQYGQPDHAEEDQTRGDYREVWDYYDARRRFVFRWGASYDGCRVQRTALNLLPLTGTADSAHQQRAGSQ